MIQKRKSIFETNSSSTHSVAISKKPINNELKGKHINFGCGEYGWDFCCEPCTANYLHTAIVENSRNLSDYNNITDKIKAVLDKYGITYDFEVVKETPYGWLCFVENDDAYIDHAADCKDLIEALLADEDLLLRFLFGDSCIYTGNDNSDNELNMCNCAEEKIWNGEHGDEFAYIKNPNHKPDEYDYFYKGN